MKKRAFEKVLPTGYAEALHIDATNKKLGLALNLIALAVIVAVLTITAGLMLADGGINLSLGGGETLIAYFIFLVGMAAYVILHELVHGAAYKLLTGEKLTFGLKWSCAFCGVPGIYVYRYAALIAVAAPLVLFTLAFLPLTIILYKISHVYCLMSAFFLGLHLGGCSGDAYVLYLLLFKYKNKNTLVRDTGPEQFFYSPEEISTNE